jgi:hypothetical protein
MYYKNNIETSTADWIRLNFDAVHGPFIAHAIGDDYDALERIGRPEEPEIDAPIEPEEPERPEPEDGMSAKDYDVLLQAYELEKSIWDKAMIEYLAAQKAYDDAWREYEEARENFENLHGFPVAWNQMWTPCDQTLRGAELEALIESGFVVYATGHSDIDFGFDYVFGVDGAGYSFYEQHWRPLRARLSRILAIRYHSEESAARHNELVRFLADEEHRLSGPDDDFIREYSL